MLFITSCLLYPNKTPKYLTVIGDVMIWVITHNLNVKNTQGKIRDFEINVMDFINVY